MLKPVALLAGLIMLACSMNVSAAGLSCEDLKSKIITKLEGKGVKHFQLDIVDKATQSSLRNVGTCEKGTKIILYSRKSKPTDEVK
jgi:hypothetical protein